MRLDEAMSALEAAGSEKTRQTYARHGVGPNQFGVSFAVLKDLAKKINVAERVGKVAVDHDDTACETPEVAGYIAKAKAQREKQAAKKKSA